MIQDILPHIFDNSYKIEEPSSGDLIWIFNGGDVLLRADSGDLHVPAYGDLCKYDQSLKSKLIYLFKVDETKAYLLMDYSSIPEGVLSSRSAGNFRDLRPQWLGFMGITAKHLWGWYSVNRFCGRCGRRTALHKVERAVYCGGCGNIVYPTISPVIMVGITNGDKLLLTHYANRPYKRYALVAGFVEIGETLEDTIRREVMEEVGLKVKNIKYYKSQPWAFTSTLISGFFAEVDGSDQVRVDHSELADAVWVRYDEIPEAESMASLSQDMQQHFKKNFK
jgi:NAD+ diphosphatase